MGSWKAVAVVATATMVAFGAARQANASATDFYGNNFDENVLIPYAVCGAEGTGEDTLFAITDPGEPGFNGGQVHVVVFNRDSVPVCDYCVGVTEGDVFPESFCRIVREEACANATSLVQTDGSRVGYITVEGSDSATGCGGNQQDVDQGDAFYGNIYYTDLDDNRATGLPAATFDEVGDRDFVGDPGSGFESFIPLEGLAQFPLATENEVGPVHWEMSFRFLQALGGVKADASTRVVIWSATTGNCSPGDAGGIGVIPDSTCLVASSSVTNELVVCDEEEDCYSAQKPPLNREVNVFFADDHVKPTHATDGGYFNLEGGATTTTLLGIPVPVEPVGEALHVIGITDQEGIVAGTPAVRAAFYAPRD